MLFGGAFGREKSRSTAPAVGKAMGWQTFRQSRFCAGLRGVSGRFRRGRRLWSAPPLHLLFFFPIGDEAARGNQRGENSQNKAGRRERRQNVAGGQIIITLREGRIKKKKLAWTGALELGDDLNCHANSRIFQVEAVSTATIRRSWSGRGSFSRQRCLAPNDMGAAPTGRPPAAPHKERKKLSAAPPGE